LDRFEVITPTDPAKTLGRFHARAGACFYMAFAESSRMGEVEARSAGDAITVERDAGAGPGDPPDQAWLHPPALGGMMLGLSRPTLAWRWSGAPERVSHG